MRLHSWSPSGSSASRLRAAVAVRAAFGLQDSASSPPAPTSREALDMARDEHLRRLETTAGDQDGGWIASWPEHTSPEQCVANLERLARQMGGRAGAVQPTFCKSGLVVGCSKAEAAAAAAAAAGTAEGAVAEAAAAVAEAAAAGLRLEPNLRVSACTSQTTPWGVIRSQGIAARTRFPVLVNADVFVFDTGVQRRHPDLRVASAVSCVAHERTPEDLNGHGTAVAGVIAALDNRRDVVGVAPGARIHSVKVLDRTGSGYISDILTGIEYMIRWKRIRARRVGAANNLVVANFSLAAFTGSEAYTALDFAIRRAAAEGITCVAAAGNEGADARLITPAHCREAITVGAIDFANRFAAFSNHGPAVDLLAPGVAVRTTYLGSSVANISGTSFSAPHVAGAALVHLLRRRGRRTPAQVAAQLRWGASRSDRKNPRVAAVPPNTTQNVLNARLV